MGSIRPTTPLKSAILLGPGAKRERHKRGDTAGRTSVDVGRIGAAFDFGGACGVSEWSQRAKLMQAQREVA